MEYLHAMLYRYHDFIAKLLFSIPACTNFAIPEPHVDIMSFAKEFVYYVL